MALPLLICFLRACIRWLPCCINNCYFHEYVLHCILIKITDYFGFVELRLQEFVQLVFAIPSHFTGTLADTLFSYCRIQAMHGTCDRQLQRKQVHKMVTSSSPVQCLHTPLLDNNLKEIKYSRKRLLMPFP